MTKANPTLLLTRPRPQAERFADACRAALGPVDVVISPVMRIAVRDVAVELGGYVGVLLTSENGALALAKIADVSGVQAWCVGNRTAEVAAELGMVAQSAAGDAANLVEMVQRARPDGVLLHVRGAESRGDVAGRLAAAGLRVESRVIYDQVAAGLTEAAQALLVGDGDVVLPLFSPRTSRLVGNAVGDARAHLAIVALSPAVAGAWTGPKAQSFTVAKRPDAAHMIKAIATLWTSLNG